MVSSFHGLFTCYFHQDDDAMKRPIALIFKFSTIKAATNYFSNANKLGEAGFGRF